MRPSRRVFALLAAHSVNRSVSTRLGIINAIVLKDIDYLDLELAQVCTAFEILILIQKWSEKMKRITMNQTDYIDFLHSQGGLTFMLHFDLQFFYCFIFIRIRLRVKKMEISTSDFFSHFCPVFVFYQLRGRGLSFDLPSGFKIKDLLTTFAVIATAQPFAH